MNVDEYGIKVWKEKDLWRIGGRTTIAGFIIFSLFFSLFFLIFALSVEMKPSEPETFLLPFIISSALSFIFTQLLLHYERKEIQELRKYRHYIKWYKPILDSVTPINVKMDGWEIRFSLKRVPRLRFTLSYGIRGKMPRSCYILRSNGIFPPCVGYAFYENDAFICRAGDVSSHRALKVLKSDASLIRKLNNIRLAEIPDMNRIWFGRERIDMELCILPSSEDVVSAIRWMVNAYRKMVKEVV